MQQRNRLSMYLLGKCSKAQICNNVPIGIRGKLSGISFNREIIKINEKK